MNTLTQTLETFRKSFGIINVTQYDNMLVYSTPAKGKGCDMARAQIAKMGLPLKATIPSTIGNTFVVEAA